ncbi:putative RNA recognition motif containing protein [Lyophyllum shimeji]|uniref:RNA recognition motif containing protein n=1 Tax=Lyophyllum shimeji TaxID=47721 RepID=A0A9P3PZT7_LYOSH|nr:putative RNA recognition motif containing protein [Lyophyllum shimeji]
MAKPALDSDLYGDIYGDDETDYPQAETEDTADAEPATEATEAPPSPATETAAQSSKPPPASQDATRSLPPKPMSPNSLSYSAQIAQQFSAYQQTPSQERQQRAEIPLPQNPRTAAGAAATSTMTDKSTDSVFGKKPSEMHDSGKLFIGGLNWDTTDEGLRDYFSQFGKVDACTIMRDASGTSRGFAFLTFEDPDAVNAVVARDHVLDGKAIDPKRAIPREEHLRNTRYFVGGLSPTTTSESMKAFFSAYGKVVDATVMVDRESGRSKGFGFVTYEDGSNADQLVGKIGLILDDKQIEVKMAQPRSQRDQARAAAGTARSDASAFPNAAAGVVGVGPQQANAMGMMFPRGQMGAQQMPMMGPAAGAAGAANMPMMNMNMNPMAMAAMGMGMGGMGGFNPMAAGMAGMNMNMMGAGGMGNMAGMGGMGNMAGMGGMGNMGAMRLGMGPMGMGGTGMGAGGMGGTGMMGAGGMGAMGAMGMGMRQGMAGMSPNFGRMSMNAATAGPGPARVTSRGQHSFHPYSR